MLVVNFITENYSWISILLLLGLNMIQSIKIKKLEKLIKKIDSKN